MGIAAAVLYAVVNSLNKLLLFLSIGARGWLVGAAVLVGAFSVAGVPPSSGFLAKLAVIDAVREHGIAVVFSESTVSSKPAEQVARETGARYGGVLYVDSLSEEGGPVPTYLDLLRVTSETIVKGLSQ